jgi:hypothetical protein
LAVPVAEVQKVLFVGYDEDDVAGTTVTVVEAFVITELEFALLETPHCGLY